MIHADILIVHGDVFTMAGNGSGYIGDGAVAITGNRIVETGTSESLSARYMTAREQTRRTAGFIIETADEICRCANREAAETRTALTR